MSEQYENTFVIGIIGENFEQNNLIGQAFGAPGTKSDIQFYNRLDSRLNQVFCAMAPVNYPEKIKPFLQSLVLSDIHILVIDLEIGLNPVIGESLIGLDVFHQLYNTTPIIVITNINDKNNWKLDETKEKLKKILDTTNIKNTELYIIKTKDEYELLKKKVIEMGIKSNETNINSDYIKILIDHCFPVKGIGTVILGLIKHGVLNAGQMLGLIGSESPEKKVIIRSIQKHDRDFKSAHKGDRIGLALKGNINSSEISRDNLLVSQGIFKSENEIWAEIYINQFYTPKGSKITYKEGIQYTALTDLKSSPFKIVEGEEISPGNSGKMKLKFDRKMYHNGTGLKGLIYDANRFQNKNRIIGYFKQI
ncbi:MAG: hypothetical protein KGD57_10395, partial [Candidatus Lokiarchaeota archaeon]|nr:hypothetical protein [Candidatus Lokiarchaeota archaeon]